MTLQPSRLIAYLQLVRLPAVFTAVADVLMGYLFVNQSLRPVPRVLALMAASGCLYMSGMVFNDYFDIERDRRERPSRPLPAGSISLRAALALGVTLMVLGVGMALGAEVLAVDTDGYSVRPPAVAALIALCILLYDGVLKATAVGPVVMGACRFLNVLLGMSASVPARGLGGFDESQLAVATAIGMYSAGITWFARDEAKAESRRTLVTGTLVLASGLALLAVFPQFSPFVQGRRQLTFQHPLVWPLLVVLLGFSILRRMLKVVAAPTPRRIQVVVKQCIFSLVIMDAAVCLAVRQPWWWSVIILSLLPPTLLLGRWLYST